jgi:hypothetical protein
VDWKFLHKVLNCFGFDEGVIKIINQLVSTVSSSVMVNGGSSNFFKPSRGLRQGDPISPILFAILAEGLGRYISKLVSSGTLSGLCPSSDRITCSHE